MHQFLLGSCTILALILGCSDEASSGSTAGAETSPPPMRDDPPIKAPADWKLERDVVAALAFSPDGTTLATACDASVILWDTVKGERRTELKDPQRAGVTVAYSPDGKLIATGATGGGVNVWEADTGKPMFNTRLDRGVKSIGFADNGATLLVVTYNDDHIGIKGFDSRSGQERLSTKVKGHFSSNASGKQESRAPGVVALSRDGTLLATAAEDAPSWDLNVRLWDVRSGAEQDRFGITDEIESMAFSPDGAYFAAGNHAGQVRLWDLRGGAGGGKSVGMFGEPDQPALATAFSPDGKLVAATSQRFIRLFNVPDGSLHSTIELDMGIITAVAFSPGGKFIAFAENHGKLYLRPISRPVAEAPVPPRDARDGRGRRDREAPPGITVLEQSNDARHARPFVSVAFSPDGDTVAAGAEDRVIRLYDASKRQLLFALEGHPGMPCNLSFSPDGKLLASAGTELMAASSANVEPGHSVRVWDVATGKDRGFLVTQKGTFPGVCFSPDGKSIAAADKNGDVRLFDPATLKPRDGFAFKTTGGVSALHFSVDGKRLAIGTSVSMAGKVQLVDAATGKEILAKQLSKPVTSVALSPDGRWLAAVGGEIKVFDTTSGREVARPEHRYHPSCAAFSPDGKTLATSSGEVKLWNVGTWKQRDEYMPSGSDEFRSIAWSPDGKSIAVVGARRVFLWTPAHN